MVLGLVILILALFVVSLVTNWHFNTQDLKINTDNVLLSSFNELDNTGWQFDLRGLDFDQKRFGADLTFPDSHLRYSGVLTKAEAINDDSDLPNQTKLLGDVYLLQEGALTNTKERIQAVLHDITCRDNFGKQFNSTLEILFENGNVLTACSDLKNE